MTKSLRMISKRRCSLISDRKIANRSSASRPMRTCTYKVSAGMCLPASRPLPPVFFAAALRARSSGIASSRSRTTLSVATNLRMSWISSKASAPLSTSGSFFAPSETNTTWHCPSVTINDSGIVATNCRSVDRTGTSAPNSDASPMPSDAFARLVPAPPSADARPHARPISNATAATAISTTTAGTCSNAIR